MAELTMMMKQMFEHQNQMFEVQDAKFAHLLSINQAAPTQLALPPGVLPTTTSVSTQGSHQSDQTDPSSSVFLPPAADQNLSLRLYNTRSQVGIIANSNQPASTLPSLVNSNQPASTLPSLVSSSSNPHPQVTEAMISAPLTSIPSIDSGLVNLPPLVPITTQTKGKDVLHTTLTSLLQADGSRDTPLESPITLENITAD
ncbi:hypothetical protein FRX31_021402 [Thalictrum thalictroides]|uniref:Uncharacterized protein n=1 Tax=Thalictrum thalictroides TaxID=46969 RepID=A0A7J6VVY2_THATH|nr:hypothetical protein FRX31_021402 [Thalictrum thalictroides]